MSVVQTVRGPVDVEHLGPTLMHEHVFVMQPEALQNYGHVWGESYWDEDARVADAIEKLRAVRAAGIGTIVDPTMPKFSADVVQMPEERYGLVFVFRVFDRVSYALVMSASRPVAPRDVVRTP